jgi:hypothetical protein
LSRGKRGLECVLPAGLLGCCVVCGGGGGGRVVGGVGAEAGGEEEGVFLRVVSVHCLQSGTLRLTF